MRGLTVVIRKGAEAGIKYGDLCNKNITQYIEWVKNWKTVQGKVWPQYSKIILVLDECRIIPYFKLCL